MKKSLLIMALAITSIFNSCSNESFSPEPLAASETAISKNTSKAPTVWEKPSNNAYELDGYIHIIASTGETFYMGERLDLKPSTSQEAMQAIDAVKEFLDGSTAKRVGLVYCSATFDGMHVSLVSVTGDGQATTFWTVYTFPNGNQYVYPDDGNIFGCGILHIQATINGGL